MSFISNLDAKLEKKNGELRAKLIAWGELLDAAGWCVALDLVGSEGIWLSKRARLDLSGRTTGMLSSGIFREYNPSGLRKIGEAAWIWPGAIEPKQEAHPGASLTRREEEVLSWLKAGKTSHEISVILGCAPRTLEKHLSNIYRKLGVSGREGALFAKPFNQP